MEAQEKKQREATQLLELLFVKLHVETEVETGKASREI